MNRIHFDEAIAPWMRLNLCQGIGPLRAARLLKVFHHPQAIFAQNLESLAEVVGGMRYAQALVRGLSADHQAVIDRAFDWLSSEDGLAPELTKVILTLADPRYPSSLKEIDDPPLLLYAIGARQWLEPSNPAWWMSSRGLVAVVGSRAPTGQGVQNAMRLSAGVQQQGVCVVSGLARGIDAAAHEGALQAACGDGPATVAVMGTGIDRIYPADHKTLAHRIARNGLLLSEQALGVGPLATNFPKRNRLITGMSQATLVVEATEKSGSLLSARLAMEQGRDVMAVPGSILSPQSKGCHWLIKQGAKLVENESDILEELQLSNLSKLLDGQAQSQPSSLNVEEGEREQDIAAPATGRLQKKSPPVNLSESSSATSATHAKEDALLTAMGYDPIDLETLQARTGLSISVLQSQLLTMELMQTVVRLPGGFFQRLALS